MLKQILEYMVRYDGDKFAKVNTINLVPAIVTDDPEDLD